MEKRPQTTHRERVGPSLLISTGVSVLLAVGFYMLDIESHLMLWAAIGFVLLIGGLMMLSESFFRVASHRAVVISVSVLAFLAWQVWLGWPRIQSETPRARTIAEMLPDSVLVLAHRSPRDMRWDKYQLWRGLPPCLKLTESVWMSEPDAILEIREAIKKSTRREVSITHARRSMQNRAEEGHLSVRFMRVDETVADLRELPSDSVGIVFELNQDSGAVVVGSPVYMRQYWSDDVCFVDWE